MDLLGLLKSITVHAKSLLNADRATVFLVHKNELWSAAATGAGQEIRIPKSTGIAGHAATTGQMVNESDCYSNSMFNPVNDIATGYRTRTMLAIPVFSKAQNKIIGVLQVINKLATSRNSKSKGNGTSATHTAAGVPVFTPADETSAFLLVAQIAVAVENCQKLTKLLQIKEMTEGRQRQSGRGRTGHETIMESPLMQAKTLTSSSGVAPG